MIHKRYSLPQEAVTISTYIELHNKVQLQLGKKQEIRQN